MCHPVNGYHSNTQKKYANEEPGGSCLATTDTHQPDDFFIDFFQMPQICKSFNMLRIHDRCLTYTGCCPNKNSSERSLKRFLLINLGEAEDQRFELFEPEGRVLKSSGASLRFIKKRFRPSEKGFGQQPVYY
jgi:hypothetical protein